MTSEEERRLNDLILPKGWKIKNRDDAARELRKPGGIIELVRDERGVMRILHRLLSSGGQIYSRV